VRSVFGAAAGLVLAAALSAQAPLGRIVFPTSGPSPAQRAFLRGVLLLHNFEYDEAILAFREAERVAPGFAMAYWGEALSYSQPLWYNEDVIKAREALARLAPAGIARAAKAPTGRERGYLDAVERLFGDGDRQSRLRAYADRMAALVREFPDDNEAAAFYALALLGTIPEGERRPDVSLKAGEIASAVFKKNPQHPGAAHYTLHAYDDGEHNRLGLEAARAYAAIAPASSHALHMPSHVFLPLGMWDEAVKSDEASWSASQAWVKRTGRSADQQDFHSLSWLHYEYLQQGRFAKARETADLVRRAVESASAGRGSGAAAPPHHVESEIGRGYGPLSLRNELASMRARYVIESRDWTAIKGQANFDNIDELFALGVAGAALGDGARAEAAIGHLRTAAGTLPDRDAREVARIMAGELSGLLQFTRGAEAAGLAELARAAEAESARPRPIARPYPIKPAAELYGELLMASGDSRAAMTQFRRSLDRTPRRWASMYGLASAAAANGSAAEAARIGREFLEMWRLADLGRSEIADMRQLVAGAKP
jgi:tetratricopeptide (TPR) repeat protein